MFGIFTFIINLVILSLTIAILIKVSKKKEGYSETQNVVKSSRHPCPFPLFPEPDKRNLKGSIDCTYAMNGSNTAFCNNWLKSYRKGELCNTNDGCNPETSGKVCCKNALKCCNQIATCGGGHDCRDKQYTPTRENNLMYDQDFIIDE